MSVTANVQATGNVLSYTSGDPGIILGSGANWLYTYSTANYLYIRGFCQHSKNNESATSKAS